MEAEQHTPAMRAQPCCRAPLRRMREEESMGVRTRISAWESWIHHTRRTVLRSQRSRPLQLTASRAQGCVINGGDPAPCEVRLSRRPAHRRQGAVFGPHAVSKRRDEGMDRPSVEATLCAPLRRADPNPWPFFCSGHTLKVGGRVSY